MRRASAGDLNDIPLVSFQEAIHATHDAQSQLLSRERVSEIHEGEIVWEGEVLPGRWTAR